MGRWITAVIATLATASMTMPIVPAASAAEAEDRPAATAAATATASPSPAATDSHATSAGQRAEAKAKALAAMQPASHVTADEAAQLAERNLPASAAKADDHGIVQATDATDATDADTKATLHDTRYDGIPLIGHWLGNVLATDTTSVMAANAADTTPSSADGTSIEHINVKWVTDNAGTDRLVLSPTTNSPVTMKARIDYALSGSNDYEPGDIQVTIPLNVVKNRDGKDEGDLQMSIPEDPSTGASFSYRRVGDRVVITNTEKLPAATQGYMELSIENIVPSEVVSGQVTDPFSARISVVTPKGTTIAKTSNGIDATINTDERVTSATKYGNVYESYDAATSGIDLALPSGFDSSKYVYVDWYMYAYVAGNQPYTISIKDTPASGSGLVSGTVIGATDATLVKDNVVDGQIDAGYRSNGYNYYRHVLVAYPKSSFTMNQPGTMKNTVTYTLTTQDTKKTTTATASATATYTPRPFEAPTGSYYVYKWGLDQGGKEGCDWDANYAYCTWNEHYRGKYPYALSLLDQGKDVDVSYHVETTNYPLAATYDGTGATDDPASYGKKAVDVTVTDYATCLGSAGCAYSDGTFASVLGQADQTLVSLRVPDPTMYTFRKGVDGKWDYYSSAAVARPDIVLYGQGADGTWTRYGTASWGSDGLGSLTLAAANGATASGDVLVMPASANVQHWKMTYSTKAAGIVASVLPTVRLHHDSAAVGKVVDEAMAASTKPQTETGNSVDMTVTDADGRQLLTMQQQAYDDLGGAVSAAWMTKSTSMKKNDTVKQAVTLGYSMTAYEQSNLTDEGDYRAAVAAGALRQDQGGTFYDLLPLNVRPDTTTVKSAGNTVTSVRTVDDWRGSGRTMLIVGVDHAPKAELITAAGGLGQRNYGERIPLSFDATYRWTDIMSLGSTLTNNAAYASSTGQIGTVKGLTGEPDDPTAGNNEYSAPATQGVTDLMKGLTGSTGTKNTVYASSTYTVDVDMAAFNGLRKQVASDVDGVYGNGVQTAITVPTGGSYRYALTVRTDPNSSVKDIVLYDALDAYQPTSEQESQGSASWKGTLIGVDTAALAAQGIKPVVYYATGDVDLASYDTGNLPSVSDASAWTTTAPADLSTVKAVAVDCSKKTDGSDFTLEPDSGIEAVVRMRAPDGDAATKAIADQAHAYNNVYLSSTQVTNGQEAAHYIHYDYTKLGLAPYDLTVAKAFDDGDNRDGLRPGSVHVQLTRNGTPQGDPVELNAGNDWKHVFESLSATDEQGNSIDWNVQETDIADGYAARIAVTNTAKGKDVTVTNVHQAATVDVQGTKTWNDQDSSKRPASVTVDLKADGKVIDTKTVSPDATGTWSIDFGERPKNQLVDGKSTPIAYSLAEHYTEGYVASYPQDTFNIVNTYHPYGDITLTKQATDTTDESASKSFTFTLTLHKADGSFDTGTYRWTRSDGTDGTVANGGTVTIQAGQQVTVHDVPSTDTYTWNEADTSGFTIGSADGMQGTVTSGGNAQADVSNTYRTAGSVELTARKTLTGRTLENRQFTFQLLDSNGNLVRSAANDTDGAIDFGQIGYSNQDAGKTYTYTIKETDQGKPGYTYDATAYRVDVAVTDNGDGTMSAQPTYYGADGKPAKDNQAPTFTNTYHATGSLALTANKVFVGGDLTKRQFTFDLVDPDGKVVSTATTDKNGEAVFTPVTYTEADAGKTYVYTVREQTDGNDKTMVWDTHTETVTATVTDNGDGTLHVDQAFSGAKDASTPLVWTNQAADGSLTLAKHLTTDAETQQHKDTVFPMEVALAPPVGAKDLNGTHTVTVTAADGTTSEQQVTIKDNKFRVGVPAEGSVTIAGIPGGTGYMVSEVATLNEDEGQAE